MIFVRTLGVVGSSSGYSFDYSSFDVEFLVVELDIHSSCSYWCYMNCISSSLAVAFDELGIVGSCSFELEWMLGKLVP
jgi:hypothetical protein